MLKNLLRDNVESIFSPLPESVQKWMLDRFVYQGVKRGKNLDNDSVPLFDTIFFEVRTRCSGHCKFCLAAVESDPRVDMSMPEVLFDKALQDLVDLKYTGRIAFHNNSEPLLFKDLAYFVSKARMTLPSCFIQILTNGRSLTIKRAEKLINAGVDQISVNVYRRDSDDPLPKSLYEIKSSLLEVMFNSEEVEIIGLGDDRSPKKQKFSFVVTPRMEDEMLDSRAGTAPNKMVPAPLARGFCQYPFTQFIVTADGRVAGCCNDVLFAAPMGNLQFSTVSEIWFGKEFANLRGHLLRNDRSCMETCRKCDFIGVKTPQPSWLSKVVYIGLRGRS